MQKNNIELDKKTVLINDLFMSNLVLKSSNEKKIEEYKSICQDLQVSSGDDLPEISTTDWSLIAAYKAKHCCDMEIVEDTIVTIDNKVVHDIKFRIEKIKENINEYVGMKASCIVSIAFKHSDYIFVLEGETKGEIGEIYQTDKDVFDFDTIFYVEHEGKKISFQELKENGLKNKYSPRTKAIKNLERLINGERDAIAKVYTSALPVWKGKYQE